MGRIPCAAPLFVCFKVGFFYGRPPVKKAPGQERKGGAPGYKAPRKITLKKPVRGALKKPTLLKSSICYVYPLLLKNTSTYPMRRRDTLKRTREGGSEGNP